MPKYKKITFVIDGFTPLSLPVGRLADYLKQFANLVGPTADVHLKKVDEGNSACLVNWAPEDVVPTVRNRIAAAQRGEAEKEANKAVLFIREMLHEDKTTGRIKEERKKIIEFPKIEIPPFGAVTEDASIEGVLIKIGGRDETIPVHIQDGENYYKCTTTRSVAKALAPNLFGDPIRVTGEGKWTREGTGTWKLEEFKIASFEPLSNDEIQQVLNRMGQAKSGWDHVKDPLAELSKIRQGTDKVN